MNHIQWPQKAARQLRKLDRLHQIAIRDGVSELVHMPRCKNVTMLVSHRYGYRLRIGNYRVLFD